MQINILFHSDILFYSDQKQISELQQKSKENIVAVKDSIQNIIQKEVKSYYSIVVQHLDQKRFRQRYNKLLKRITGVKNDYIDKDKHENVQKKLFDTLAVIEEKPNIQDCCRVGVENAVKHKPIKFIMRVRTTPNNQSINVHNYTPRRGSNLSTFAPTEVTKKGKLSESSLKR